VLKKKNAWAAWDVLGFRAVNSPPISLRKFWDSSRYQGEKLATSCGDSTWRQSLKGKILSLLKSI